MGKRFKEFLIDILVKTYQIILGIAIIHPVVMKKIDPFIFIASVLFLFYELGLFPADWRDKYGSKLGCRDINCWNVSSYRNCNYTFTNFCSSQNNLA